MKKRKRKYSSVRLPAVVFIVFYLAVNSLSTYVFYNDYQSKMNLFTEIAAESGGRGIDIAARLLKGKDTVTNKQGQELLEQYGYWNIEGNVLYQRFKRNVIVTGLGTAVLTVLFYILLYRCLKREVKKQKKLYEEMEQTLIRFRENNFETPLETDGRDEQEKIRYQLDAIGNHIMLLKEEARAEKESMKEIVADISHQLKTPVAALDTCFSVLLRDNLSAEEQQEFRIRCRSALDGLETLLQSLLQISKMEAGLIRIHRQTLPLMETILYAVNRIYPKADEKQIEFIFECDQFMENHEIMQDKIWLSEALINVLDNAVKYSPNHSEIRIRLQSRIGFARIEIEDRGIGIPKEEYHKIFQRFFRGSTPEVKEKSGSGIGLFLSREIIERHGGTITVSSDLKKGSIFVIQLPDNTL